MRALGAAEVLLQGVAMTPCVMTDGPPPVGLHATHEGELIFAGHTFRCYQLSDGRRVLDAGDVHSFFGGEQ